MRDRHGSPFEHNSMTFYVQAPIFVFREFMRHRIASYNEESGRYRELRPVFYVPGPDRNLVQVGKAGAYEFLPGTPEQTELTDVATREAIATEAYESYQRMLDAGIAREVARIVLPLNIYSSMYVTMNARSLMNFLSLRTKREGTHFPSFPQREIEMVAEKMEHIWTDLMPFTYAAFNGNGRVAALTRGGLMAKTALITGASSGLGAEYARQLAARGADLVLVARDRGALERLGAELVRDHGISYEVLAVDLTKPRQLQKVTDRLVDVARPIEMLVNNAGFGLDLAFENNDIEDEARHLALHVEVPMRLMRAILPGMLERGSGRIVNVASVAGFIPRSTYGACKGWLIELQPVGERAICTEWGHGYGGLPRVHAHGIP